MAFYDVQFPTDISGGSKGGPGFKTNSMTIESGYERRRVRWPLPRHSYDAAYGVRTPEQMSVLIDFFYVMQGKAHGFRFRDPLDHKTCPYNSTVAGDDEVLVADALGGETTFQLFKSYVLLTTTIQRTLTKIVPGTFILWKNSAPLTETTHFTLDYNTGILTLVTPLVLHDTLSFGCEYDVPCRFDTDELSIQLNKAAVGQTTIPIVEIKV